MAGPKPINLDDLNEEDRSSLDGLIQKLVTKEKERQAGADADHASDHDSNHYSKP